MTKKRNTRTKKMKGKGNIVVHKIEQNNASEFEEKVKNMTGPILFHHPGCIHCVMMRPKWIQVIKKLNNKNINCQIVEVNADALPMIHHPLGKVDGFPRLINVQNGVEKDVFMEERNVENMLKFVINNLKGNKNLPYDYNLNKKGDIIKLTDQNNIKRVRKNDKYGKNRKTNKTKKKRR
jgi:thiol-disulfide isomerase/thioredoxin